MWYLTEMCSIKHTVILTLSDWEVKGTHEPHATHIRHHNNLMTLDGSYLKQNSIPLLDLLQEISKHAMEGVKKELPQCTTPLTSTEDWRCGRWLGGSRLRHVGSFGFSWLWADLSFKSSWILMKGNRGTRVRSGLSSKLSWLVWGNECLRWDEEPREQLHHMGSTAYWCYLLQWVTSRWVKMGNICITYTVSLNEPVMRRQKTRGVWVMSRSVCLCFCITLTYTCKTLIAGELSLYLTKLHWLCWDREKGKMTFTKHGGPAPSPSNTPVPQFPYPWLDRTK